MIFSFKNPALFFSNDFINLQSMKQKKIIADNKTMKGFKINPSLDEKYSNDPFFKEKEMNAIRILKTVGLPK